MTPLVVVQSVGLTCAVLASFIWFAERPDATEARAAVVSFVVVLSMLTFGEAQKRRMIRVGNWIYPAGALLAVGVLSLAVLTAFGPGMRPDPRPAVEALHAYVDGWRPR